MCEGGRQRQRETSSSQCRVKCDSRMDAIQCCLAFLLLFFNAWIHQSEGKKPVCLCVCVAVWLCVAVVIYFPFLSEVVWRKPPCVLLFVWRSEAVRTRRLFSKMAQVRERKSRAFHRNVYCFGEGGMCLCLCLCLV